MRQGVALVLDEYDAGRPDVMFVLQRLLEAQGRLVLLEQQRVVIPQPSFRLFATANTAGLGDASGQFQGTVAINQAQLDRWQLIARLGWPQPAAEQHLLRSRVPVLAQPGYQSQVIAMVELAGLLRTAQADGQLSVAMSPRTLLHWGENLVLLGDLAVALRLSYLHRCEPAEWPLVAELYQRCFGAELPVALP
jgi:cobaltochelatase CobS